jgi:hypothetical protein
VPLQPRYVKIEGRYGWIADLVQLVFWGGFVIAVFAMMWRQHGWEMFSPWVDLWNWVRSHF